VKKSADKINDRSKTFYVFRKWCIIWTIKSFGNQAFRKIISCNLVSGSKRRVRKGGKIEWRRFN